MALLRWVMQSTMTQLLCDNPPPCSFHADLAYHHRRGPLSLLNDSRASDTGRGQDPDLYRPGQGVTIDGHVVGGGHTHRFGDRQPPGELGAMEHRVDQWQRFRAGLRDPRSDPIVLGEFEDGGLHTDRG